MDGIGIAGSGRIARSFAARLVEAGLKVSTFGVSTPDGVADRSVRAAQRFVSGLETLVLVPADIAETEALLFEEQGFARNTRSLSTIVIVATLSPRYVRALRGRIDAQISLIDAPALGTGRIADQGRLTLFLGGPQDRIAVMKPLFDIISKKTVRMGGFGSAMAAKVMNDFLAATTTAVTRIALDWAEAQGIDEARIVELAGRGGDGDHTPESGPTYCPIGQQTEESITMLIHEVENAFDAALAGAHLTPPRAFEDMMRNVKSRHLH
jgi:3-hydroxyisobutyrate dehydrogenase-like beta-hydroxyacid dehydrogenase